MPLEGSARALDEAALGLARRGPDNLVLIAGGGIGGLATALALARQAIPSHLFERRAEFAEEGAGIQIGPNGTRILSALGVTPALAPLAANPTALHVMDGETARPLARLPLGPWLAGRHGAPYWTLHRADLHDALVRRARDEPLIRLSMAAEIEACHQDASGVTAVASGGRSWTGAAMIAADGVHSTFAQRLSHRAGRTPSGKCAVRAVLAAADIPPGIDHNVTTIWLRPKAHVVHYPVRAGRDMAIVAVFDGLFTDTGWSIPVLPAWVTQQTADFPSPLRELMATPRSWRRWSLMSASPLASWTDDRIALLGDAAHPVMPFLAQGAVLALEDAMVLARCLAERPGAVTLALKAYDKRRRPRAHRVARASHRNGSIYHATGIVRLIRDRLLQSVPPERLMANYDWLYGWREG